MRGGGTMARYLTHPEVGGALQVAFVGSMTRKQGTETRLKQGMETRRKLEMETRRKFQILGVLLLEVGSGGSPEGLGHEADDD